jgi:hypothetical protein
MDIQEGSFMLLKIAVALFIIGAIFGLIVLTSILRNKPTPKPVVLFHGLFVATALVIVLITVFSGQTDKLLVTSLVLFILAALGGVTMLVSDLVTGSVPKPLAIIHPLVAAAGLIALIVYILPMG